jgi:hypothetical protein
MLVRFTAFALLIAPVCPAVIIDRIAVVVGNAIVKDSDIDRNIRVTAFLNGEPVDLGPASRKKAASRLIEQAFIRHEIDIGDYPMVTREEADQQLKRLEKERFGSDAAVQAVLKKDGINRMDVLFEYEWQLTVLQFIDIRFKPAVLISDADIEKYYRNHAAELRRTNPGKTTLDDLRDQIRDILTGEKVNDQFFSWLNEQRKSNKVEFREESLND